MFGSPQNLGLVKPLSMTVVDENTVWRGGPGSRMEIHAALPLPE